MRSLFRCSSSAAFMVGSSSISTSPALTLCPSRTWMARTTPVSNGWMILVRPVGMILPGADGDDVDRAEARPGERQRQNTAMMV